MKTGDVVLMKSCTIRTGLDKHDAQLGYKAPKDGAMVFLALGTVNKENIERFSPTDILKELGWEPIRELTCQYTKSKSDGYGTNWKSQCDNEVYYSAPIDVGWAHDPLPNTHGKYCQFCGKLITLGK